MKDIVVRTAGWVGTAAMVAAPPMIDTSFGKWIAVVGLILLTVQAVELKAKNLIALNALGALGYLVSIYR